MQMAFSERMIPALVQAGIEWVMVPNNHISRCCTNYSYSPVRAFRSVTFSYYESGCNACFLSRYSSRNARLIVDVQSGDNNNPPNPADQINPPQSDWFVQSISRGCTPNNAYV